MKRNNAEKSKTTSVREEVFAILESYKDRIMQLSILFDEMSWTDIQEMITDDMLILFAYRSYKNWYTPLANDQESAINSSEMEYTDKMQHNLYTLYGAEVLKERYSSKEMFISLFNTKDYYNKLIGCDPFSFDINDYFKLLYNCVEKIENNTDDQFSDLIYTLYIEETFSPMLCETLCKAFDRAQNSYVTKSKQIKQLSQINKKYHSNKGMMALKHLLNSHNTEAFNYIRNYLQDIANDIEKIYRSLTSDPYYLLDSNIYINSCEGYVPPIKYDYRLIKKIYNIWRLSNEDYNPEIQQLLPISISSGILIVPWYRELFYYFRNKVVALDFIIDCINDNKDIYEQNKDKKNYSLFFRKSVSEWIILSVLNEKANGISDNQVKEILLDYTSSIRDMIKEYKFSNKDDTNYNKAKMHYIIARKHQSVLDIINHKEEVNKPDDNVSSKQCNANENKLDNSDSDDLPDKFRTPCDHDKEASNQTRCEDYFHNANLVIEALLSPSPQITATEYFNIIYGFLSGLINSLSARPFCIPKYEALCFGYTEKVLLRYAKTLREQFLVNSRCVILERIGKYLTKTPDSISSAFYDMKKVISKKVRIIDEQLMIFLKAMEEVIDVIQKKIAPDVLDSCQTLTEEFWSLDIPEYNQEFSYNKIFNIYIHKWIKSFIPGTKHTYIPESSDEGITVDIFHHDKPDNFPFGDYFHYCMIDLYEKKNKKSIKWENPD